MNQFYKSLELPIAYIHYIVLCNYTLHFTDAFHLAVLYTDLHAEPNTLKVNLVLFIRRLLLKSIAMYKQPHYLQ